MTDEEFLKRMKAARARFREAKMKAHFPVNAKMRYDVPRAGLRAGRNGKVRRVPQRTAGRFVGKADA